MARLGTIAQGDLVGAGATTLVTPVTVYASSQETILAAVLAAGSGNTLVGVSDSRGGTWVIDQSVATTFGTLYIVRSRVAVPLVVGDTITFTFSGVSQFHSAVASAYSSVLDDPFDGAAAGSGSGTAPATGTITGGIGIAYEGVIVSASVASGGPYVATIPASVTIPAGDTLLVEVSAKSRAVATGASDSQGNTYVVDVVESDQSTSSVSLVRCPVTTPLNGGDTVTVALSADQDMVVTLHHLSGLAAKPVQATAVLDHPIPAQPSISIDGVLAGQLVIAAWSWRGGTAGITPDAGWAVSEYVTTGGGADRFGQLAYGIAAASGTVTVSGSFPSGHRHAAVAVAYKAESPSPASETVFQQDTFTRTVAAGLGTPDLGAWLPQNGTTLVSVDGSQVVYAPTGGGLTRVYLTDGLDHADTIHQSTVQFPDAAPSGSGGLYAMHVHRDQIGGPDLRCGLAFEVGGDLRIFFDSSTNSGYHGYGFVTVAAAGTWASSDVWTYETRVRGDQYQARAWRSGVDPVPTWFTKQIIYPEQLVAGQNGLWLFASGSVTSPGRFFIQDTTISDLPADVPTLSGPDDLLFSALATGGGVLRPIVAPTAPYKLNGGHTASDGVATGRTLTTMDAETTIPGPQTASAALSVSEPWAMLLAAYKARNALDGFDVEAGWDDNPTGLFQIGVSKIERGDVLGGAFNPVILTSLTAETYDLHIRRGRQDATSAIQAGECSVTLVDRSGKYNVANEASPLAGRLDAARPFTVTATFEGVTYPLYSGYTMETTAAQGKASPYATLSATDLFERLQHEYPVIAVQASTTTGAAIGLVLDRVGWPAASRDLAVGDPIVNFSADGSTDALSLIDTLLSVEGGAFFMSAAGLATYIDYQGRASRAATIRSTNLVSPGISLANVYNRARVQRDGGPEQSYTDGESANKYGVRDAPGTPVQSPLLPTDEAAKALAARIINLGGNLVSPIWQLTLRRDPNDPDTYVQMLARDVGDRVSVADPGSGTGGDYTIEGITHQVSAGGLDHQVTWVLRERATNLFTIGQSVIGGPDQIAA